MWLLKIVIKQYKLYKYKIICKTVKAFCRTGYTTLEELKSGDRIKQRLYENIVEFVSVS